MKRVPGPTARLAQWLARTPRVRDQRALALAKDALKDGIACMLAGARDPATEAAFAAAHGWGAGRCSSVGRALRLAAPGAAFVNGTAAHALDFDDNYHPMAGHATAVLAPAVLALGEELDASGAAVLDAYVAGLEAQAAVGDGVNLAHYERGWHSTSTIGVFGAAAAGARLLKLDVEGCTAALSLAFSMAAGSKRQFGTLAKPMHAGLAAMHGVMAASLAAQGARGATEVLEGEWAFSDLFGAPGAPGYRRARDRRLAILRYGLKAKIHPCCASVHCAVDALLELRAEHGFAAADVRRVEAIVNRVSFDNLRYAAPRTPSESRFSMPWALALALAQGRLGLADFTPAALSRPDLRALLPRMTMRCTTAARPHPIAENGREPARVIVVLNDGRRLERYSQYPRGTLQAPLARGQLDLKFDDCAPGRVALRRRLDALEGERDLRAIAAALRRAPPRRRSPSASRGAQARRR